MGHSIRLFVGERAAFSAFDAAFPGVSLFRLRAAAALVVLPLDDELQDRFHRSYGTGDWADTGGPLLSTSDMAFAARASVVAPLGFVETRYFGGTGSQHAVLWRAGALAIGPLSLDAQIAPQRPTSLWPINVVLRALGVMAAAREDEFTAAGMGDYRSNDAIMSRAMPVA